MGDKGEIRRSARRTHHPTKRNKKWYNGRQGETRPSMGDKGRQDPRKADTPSNKGNKKGGNGRQGETRPSGRRTHHPTKGNRRGTMGDKGRQDPREGGHTIPHQGGHLEIALRTSNRTLFGE